MLNLSGGIISATLKDRVDAFETEIAKSAKEEVLIFGKGLLNRVDIPNVPKATYCIPIHFYDNSCMSSHESISLFYFNKDLSVVAEKVISNRYDPEEIELTLENTPDFISVETMEILGFKV